MSTSDPPTSHRPRPHTLSLTGIPHLNSSSDALNSENTSGLDHGFDHDRTPSPVSTGIPDEERSDMSTSEPQSAGADESSSGLEDVEDAAVWASRGGGLVGIGIGGGNGSAGDGRERVAVVGAGISGLATAYFLRHTHRVTLFEAEERLGGHAWTVRLPDLPPIDLGFQVFNLTTYPNLVALLQELGVPTSPSSMSFSASVEVKGRRFEWASWGLKTVFPRPTSVLDKERWTLLYDTIRFGRNAPGHAKGEDRDLLMHEYLRKHSYSTVFIQAYLQPMIAAIWSVPNQTALSMPFATLVQFMVNHHLLSTGWPPRPVWRVIDGRSQEYVDKITASLPDVRVGTGVTNVLHRDDRGVTLQDVRGNTHRFDHVVFATHSDTTMRILGPQATPEERETVGMIKYQANRCILHTDASFMPEDRALWTSWNALASSADDRPVTCTYWCNLLQNIPSDPNTPDIFLTLNPERMPEGVLGEYTLDHPILSQDAVEAQARVPELQGKSRTYFAGAWTRYGFHEDGLLSAIRVAESFGWRRPWHEISPSPVPDLTSYLSFKVVERVLRRGVEKGRLRMVLPRGNEVVFGALEEGAKLARAGGHVGDASVSTMRVHSMSTFTSILKNGATGLAEAYMDNLFDVDGDLSTLTTVLCLNRERLEALKAQLGPVQYLTSLSRAYRHLYRSRNSLAAAKDNITAHYDMGNAMYGLFLDPAMQYSCAEFAKGDTLETAQRRKMDSICSQLELGRDSNVLEIGCGWGGLAIHAVSKFGCRWTGITLSPAQKKHADAAIAAAGLSHKISIFLLDYRELPQFYRASFDRVVSIEMIEAVGHQNLPRFFETVDQVLADGGKAVVQVITIPEERYKGYMKSSDFIKDYIFPGGKEFFDGWIRDVGCECCLLTD